MNCELGENVRTKKTILLASVACALLPLIGSAITVECVDDGTTRHPFTIGSFGWDYSYKVTLGVGETLDWFHVGVGSDNITNFEVVDESTLALVAGWSGQLVSRSEDQGTLVDHLGSISEWTGNTAGVAAWATPFSGITEGVYYFGFDCPDPTGVFGFRAENDFTEVLVEDWDASVGQGTGPIHAPIPEPATLSMLLVASGLIGLIRKFQRTSY